MINNCNTDDIKNNDYNHDETYYNLVARQYCKEWWNGEIGVSTIASELLGTTGGASACLNWLTLASYIWKGNSTGWGVTNFVKPNYWGKPLITYFGCLPQLVGGDTSCQCSWAHEMKQQQKLAAYTVTRCITLVPSLSLMTTFAVQSLLA